MIVVTGGTGFLGAHLICRLLQKGHQLAALKRETSSLARFETVFQYYFPEQSSSQYPVRWVDCDIMDITGLLNYIQEDDLVYHCAAEVHFRAGNGDRQFQVNVRGTANVVDACLAVKARKLVHVSSIGSLGDPVDGQMVNEETPRKESAKQSQYSKTKYLGELEVFRGMAEGLNAVIVNPSVIIGPGDTHSGMHALIALIREGLSYYPCGANACVDVRDVADAMILLMETGLQGERFILSAENLSYQRLEEIIAAALGVKPPSKKASKRLLKFVSLAGSLREKFTGRPNALTRDLIRISSSTSAYDPAKFMIATGFRFIPVEQSLKDSCEFYLRLQSVHVS